MDGMSFRVLPFARYAFVFHYSGEIRQMQGKSRKKYQEWNVGTVICGAVHLAARYLGQ